MDQVVLQIALTSLMPNLKNTMTCTPTTLSSQPETEYTYVNYHVTHVQGGGDNPDHPSPITKQSVDGAYALIVNSLKLSTV